MRAGRNFSWIKDPTKTTNSSGMWNLNEINNHINNNNWPKLNESPNQYNIGAAYINYISQGLKPRYDIGAAYLNLSGIKNPNLHLGQTYLNVAVNSINSADFTTPSTPSGVVANLISGGKYVYLSFDPLSGPITNYLAQFSTDNGSTWTSVSKPLSSSRTIEIFNLDPKTSYVFRVAAANYAGTSNYSTPSTSITTGNNFPYATLGYLRGQFTSSADATQMSNGNLLTFPITDTTAYPTINYSGVGAGAAYGFIAIGYFVPPTTGTYTFFTSSDDGSAVWVGDIAEAVSGRTLTNAVLNNNATGTQGNTKRSGTISLTANTVYAIRIVHRTGGGGDNLTFSWSGPGISETTNLSQYFYGINSF